jgi:hypothetical protein
MICPDWFIFTQGTLLKESALVYLFNKVLKKAIRNLLPYEIEHLKIEAFYTEQAKLKKLFL